MHRTALIATLTGVYLHAALSDTLFANPRAAVQFFDSTTADRAL